MTLHEQQQFLADLVAHKDVILAEFLQAKRRAIAIPDYDEAHTPVPNWKGVALWFHHRPWPFNQRIMKKTTEMVRTGPEHNTTAITILDPHSRTPTHHHKEWGNKIIVQLPLVIPEGDTGFWVEGRVHHWKDGELFAFDVAKEHYGYNNTDQERAIFLLDFDAEEWGEALAPYMTT
jgi:aspartyl/asparaginyl beta-hydroxylase (cupin superfamily)